MDTNQETSQLDLNNLNKVESKSIDISQYVGKKVKIAVVEPIQTMYGTALKVKTDVIDTVKGKEENIELRASKLFSLSENNEIITDSKLDKFLKQQKVEQPAQLIGTEVQILKEYKNDKEYMTF